MARKNKMHNDYVQTRTLVCTMKTSHVTTKPLHQHDHDDKTVRQWYIEELCPCPGPVPHELGQGQASHGHSHGDDSGLILSVYGHCMQLEIQHLCHSLSILRLTQPDPAEESLCSRYFKFQVCTVNLNIKLMMSLQTQIGLKHSRVLVLVLLRVRLVLVTVLVLSLAVRARQLRQMCCWLCRLRGAAGQAGPNLNVVLAHGRHNELLECAASPVDVLLALGLRGRAAVLSQAAGREFKPDSDLKYLAPAPRAGGFKLRLHIFKRNPVTNLAMLNHFEKPFS